MTTNELRSRLMVLRAEGAAASLEGLDTCGPYARHLRSETEATHHAWVGAAVTEIASFRAQLGGRQPG